MATCATGSTVQSQSRMCFAWVSQSVLVLSLVDRPIDRPLIRTEGHSGAGAVEADAPRALPGGEGQGHGRQQLAGQGRGDGRPRWLLLALVLLHQVDWWGEEGVWDGRGHEGMYVIHPTSPAPAAFITTTRPVARVSGGIKPSAVQQHPRSRSAPVAAFMLACLASVDCWRQVRCVC